MNNLLEIADRLRKSKKAVISGHTMPDGDSIGSVLAMSLLLTEIGVENQVTSYDSIPAMYRFLPGVEKAIPFDHLRDDYDTAVILDCTDLNRLGDGLDKALAQIPMIINIDHHVSNQEFGHLNYVDSGAAATGEIVFELIEKMGVPLNREMAVNLYTALVMDTGSFMFDNTTDRTHAITAELFKSGIDAAQINNNLFENKDIVQLKLLGYGLTRLKTTADGRIAWVTIPLEAIRELGAQDEHADGIINYPRMINGVEVGLLFREISPGKFKVGFRSKKQVDVNKLAAVFGGGGHPRASGCIIEGTIEEIEKRVIELCLSSI